MSYYSSRRRMRGDLAEDAVVVVGSIGILAVVGLGAWAIVEASTADYDTVEYCVTRTDPPVRVDDRKCDFPASQEEAAAHGTYLVQLPEDDGSSLVIVNLGQPVYAPGTRPVGSFTPPGPRSAGIVRAPAPGVGQPTTISRGGLGVSSHGTAGS